MTIKFKNGSSDDIIGPASTLASGVAVGATSMTVAAGTGDRFPVVESPHIAYVTLQNATKIEVVKITERLTGADTMTIVKAQEGTTDRAWLAGDVVSMRLTAAQAESAVNAQDIAAAALAAHEADAADAHDASAISYDKTGTTITVDTVQAALTELDSDLTAHVGDATAAHAASAINIVDVAGDFAATNVEDALAELQSEKASTTALADVIANSTSATPDVAADYFMFEDATDNTQKKALLSAISGVGGPGYAWASVSRASGTPIQNTSGKPIVFAMATSNAGAGASVQIDVSDDNVLYVTAFADSNGVTGNRSGGAVVVPDQHWYKPTFSGTVVFQSELTL